jgi:hypothetical protein
LARSFSEYRNPYKKNPLFPTPFGCIPRNMLLASVSCSSVWQSKQELKQRKMTCCVRLTKCIICIRNTRKWSSRVAAILLRAIKKGSSTPHWLEVSHRHTAIHHNSQEPSTMKHKHTSWPVRSAYQPPASSTFLSELTSHQQPANSTFLSQQTSTSHQPPAKRTG